MFYWLYERMLLSQVQLLPRHICFMLSSADLAADPEKCARVAGWCTEINAILARSHPPADSGDRTAIKSLTFHVNPLSDEEVARCLPAIKKIAEVARLVLHYGNKEEVSAAAFRSWSLSGRAGGKRSPTA
jgi:undecaprenyl diphosphate synthase